MADSSIKGKRGVEAGNQVPYWVHDPADDCTYLGTVTAFSGAITDLYFHFDLHSHHKWRYCYQDNEDPCSFGVISSGSKYNDKGFGAMARELAQMKGLLEFSNCGCADNSCSSMHPEVIERPRTWCTNCKQERVLKSIKL